MADWGQNDEVVTPAKTAAPVAKQSSSWGQDDEVVTKPAAKQEAKPTGITDQLKAGGEAFVRGLPATGGFWAGSAAGATAVAPYAASIAPAAPVVAGAIELLGGLAGGVISAGAVDWATDKLSALMDPVGHAKWKETQKQFPEATTAGSFASGFAGSSWRTAPEVAGKLMSKPIVQRATSGTLMAGFDATQQYLQTGTVDPKMVVASAAGGAALPGANVAGRVAQKIGTKAVEAIKPTPKTVDADLPPPPKGATPEEKAAYLKQLETVKAQRDATAPLVEAAIRNKETGAIERMGPKHNPVRKAETVDTHDQGFVDERGNFHERKSAVEQAKRSGQIPEDHVLENPPGELPGLHSGDLRKAGDERFKITEEQPAVRPTDSGVPKEEVKTPGSPDELPVDRTKTDPRDVKDEKEFLEIAQDIYEKHGEVEATKFFEGWSEFKKTWAEPVKEAEKFVGTNIKNKLANERLIHNETDKIMKGITDPVRREAIAEAVDKGDTSGLSAEEKAVADQYSKLVKDIGDRAVEAGVVKGLLEDYVTHILDWAGAPKGAKEEFLQSLLGTAPRDPAMKGMTTESKFGKERKFRTFADLEWFINEANARIAASGKSDFRLKIKTKDIAEIYKEYALSMEKAIENKKLVDSLKQVRNVNGESLIKEVNKDNPMPYGWEMMASPQFAGYAVHPDLMPALKFVFDAGPGDLMKAFGAISQLTKRLNVIGSFFHAKSLMEVMSSSKIPLWTPIKEAIVLPLVEKGVKATTGKELQLSAISKAVEQFKNGGVGDNVDKWIKEGGLQLEMPEDVTQGLMSSMGKVADELIGKFGPKTRILEKSLSTVEKYTLGMFDKYTWDYLHTGGKIMVADAYLDKARLQAAKEGKPFDEVAARKEISAFVNDSFGGLNWFDAATQTQNEFAKRIAMAAYNPEGRRALQLALFAPDWTLSTVRAFTAALPKELNPTKWHPVEGIKGMMAPTTKADYARLYQFKTALTYLTLLNAINMMTANRPIWDNKDPTRIEWPDGTSMQAMKHAMEPYHWIMDPDKTLSNKLGFLPKAAVVGLGGLEYASPTAQKLVDPSAAGRLKAVGKMALPFQFQAGSSAPEGEATKRAVLGTMGFPIYGSTPEQKKAARAEREKQLKEAARKYHEKAKEKGWEQ